ncbi:MAG: hypothetical protein QG641_1250 [Candidatus Poribacteria bacterium]|nr:hypothetical protein [Candidatus Poribacteria bacterium]
MADINMKNRTKLLKDEVIDQIVIDQADDESKWKEPIKTQGIKEFSLTIPYELIERAAFFVRLNREPSVGDWLRRIIKERLDFEEAIFDELKQELTTKTNK